MQVSGTCRICGNSGTWECIICNTLEDAEARPNGFAVFITKYPFFDDFIFACPNCFRP